MPEEPEAPQNTNQINESDLRSGVNIPELMARVGGDRDLLRDLCSMFIAEAPGMLAGLRRAVDSADCAAVSRAAHGMKGAIGIFGKGPSYELALSLEMSGRGNRAAEIEPGYQALARSVEELKSQLADLILLSRGKE